MKNSPKQTYWQSLKELAPEYLDKGRAGGDSLKREFPSPPLSMAEAGEGASRREFLQLMGAGIALASAGCMRRPAEKIVPYAKRPPDVIPGEASFYASSFYDSGEGFSALIKTREGRPIKIEGNPDAAMLNGRGLSARAHAHILSLYDPERIKNPKQNLFNREKSSRETINISWEALDKTLSEELQKGQTALLTPRLPSPSVQKLIGEFKQAFSARHYVWDPISFEDLSEAQKISYSREEAIVPSYNFSRARVIFALNCDFLGTWLSPADFQRQFAKTRRPGPEMSRLTVLETLMTLTGANADERHRLAHKDQLSALMGLAMALERAGHIRLPPELLPLAKSYEPLIESLPFPKSRLNEWADQLGKNRGRGLIVYGEPGGQTEEARAIHVMANFLNSALGNDGITVSRRRAHAHKFGSYGEIKSLIEALNSKDIQNLIIYKVNPVYSYPDQEGLLKALKKAKTTVYAGDRIDETGFHADYIAPDSHDLEKWGDWEFKKGVFAVQQPAIRPLYKTRAFEDSLLAWIKGRWERPIALPDKQASSGQSHLSAEGRERPPGRPNKQAENFYRYIKNRWESEQGPGFWSRFLEKGVWSAENPKLSQPRAFRPEAAALLAKALKKNLESQPQNPQETQNGRESGSGQNSPAASSSGQSSPKEKFPYHLSLYQTAGLKSGDMSNVAWLQEFPDPVTKICWDNYLCLSPKAAIKEGLREGDMAQIRLSGGKALKAPVHIQPGQEDSALALAVGYGRTRAGSVGNHVGVNAWRLASAGGGGPQAGAAFAGLPASLKKTGESAQLANVQEHHSMEGRDIVLETTLEKFQGNPSSGIPKHHSGPSLWSKHKYSGHKWGMAIDLNSCIGCGACMLACQSENNIPTVGKQYVLEGREMHWIRVDRYYKGGAENPSALHQPVTCMHCDNAPCETVCPVLATVHSSEGTNDMIYNRCVGTRYCANNCPYKVRRFNWFGYDKKIRAPLDMALNPEVTVRGRGVMEKCTFCVQRIEEGKAQAKKEGRPLKDGEIQTACQQSCPSEAIVFGDLNDPGSAVARAFQAKNSYALLDDMLNTKPAVKYRTKIRNSPAGGREGSASRGAKPKASGH